MQYFFASSTSTPIANKEKPIIPPDSMSKIQAIKNKSYEMEQQLPALLDDFQKYYVFSEKNPEVPEYSTMFENTKFHLNKMNAQLTQATMQSDEMTTNLNAALNITNDQITYLKTATKPYVQQLKNIQDRQNTSSLMVDNYVQLYSMTYLNNFALFLGILLELFVFRNMFSSGDASAPAAAARPPVVALGEPRRIPQRPRRQ